MEIKSLILGVIFTLGIFAVKSGIGLFYLLSDKSKKRFIIVSFTIFSYFFLFSVSYLILNKINILNYFSYFEKFLKTGMLLHFILAVGMLWWGISVLTKLEENSKAYIMLIFPCPLCSIVIFLSISFLIKFIGKYDFSYNMVFFAGFTMLQIFTVILLKIFSKIFKIKKVNDMLGYSLIAVGCYFLITYCFAPAFSQVNKIYRLANYSKIHFVLKKHDLLIVLLAGILILSGFLFNKRRIK